MTASAYAARIFGVLLSVLSGTITALDAEESPSFRSQIAPILQANCVACHNAKKAEGNYRLDTFAELSQAGDSGEPPLTAGDPAASELLRRLTTADPSERMPAETDPLPPEQIAEVQRWIAAGAAFDGQDPDELLAFVIPAAQYPDPPPQYPSAVPITAIAFTPDARQIAAAGYHEVTIWNPDGTLVRRVPNVGQRTYALKFSSDGNTLVVGGGEPGVSGEVRLVDFHSGQVRGVAARAADVVLAVAVHPAGGALAVASADKRIYLVDAETLETKRTIAAHADWVTAVAFNHDGSRLVSASRDKSCKVFDVENGQLLVSYQGHGATVRSVAFMPEGNEVLSVGDDNKLHRWAIEKAERKAEVALAGSGYQFSLGPSELFVPLTAGRVLKIGLGDNQIAAEYPGHSDWVLCTAIDLEGGQLAAGSYDGKVQVWSLDGSPLHSWLAKP